MYLCTMTTPPLISIITVTYQAESLLERTIESVLAQTYPHIEYLIIDGGSRDGTTDIIRRYAEHLAYWVSEPDKGLYDAMNKGLAAAKGDYVWFINAGDRIFAPDTLSRIFAQAPWAEVYYGDTEYRTLSEEYMGLRSEVTPHRLPPQLSWRSMARGMVVCHQAFIAQRSIAPSYDWHTHPYSADLDWVIQCLKQAQSATHTQQVLAVYLQGGFSRKHLKCSLTDRFKILQKHFGLLPTLWNHLRIALRGAWFIAKRRKGY